MTKKKSKTYSSEEVKKMIDEKKCPHGFEDGCVLCMVAGRRMRPSQIRK